MNLYIILGFSRENELRNLRMEINQVEGDPWEIGEGMEEIANQNADKEAQVSDNFDDDENEPDKDNGYDDNDPEDDNDQDDENESNEDQSDEINGSRLIENIFFEPPGDDDQLSINSIEQVRNILIYFKFKFCDITVYNSK